MLYTQPNSSIYIQHYASVCVIESFNITIEVYCYSIIHMQTETTEPSLIKRITADADEASAEAAAKLLSAPPSRCVYKRKSKR